MLCKENFALSQEYKEAVSEALKILNKKNLALILQGVSFPSSDGENTGFGTYNSQGAKRVFDFMSGVFNALQLGPAGKTKISDPSPYCGTVFSKNPLFINLQALTTKEWENLLSEKTLENIVNNNPSKGTNRASYVYAIERCDAAMKEVYANFNKKASWGLKKKFDKFKKENAYWLDNDALYEAF